MRPKIVALRTLLLLVDTTFNVKKDKRYAGKHVNNAAQATAMCGH